MSTFERPRATRGSVSLADVARLAGTSHSTASRAINGRAGVKPQVRQQVLDAAKELGYIPNAAARNLVMQRTGLIALVFCDPKQVVGTTFFSELVASVVTSLDEADYRAAIILPGRHRALSSSEAAISLENYDGAVVIGHHSGDPLLKQFAKRNLPTVVFGRPLNAPALSFVDVDNKNSAQQATAHLLETNRRNLVFLAGPPDTSWGVDRTDGYLKAVRKALPHEGVTAQIQQCEFSAEGGYAGTLAALEQWPQTDALLVSSEALLPGVVAALDKMGKSIPEDLGLVAFDDGPHLWFAGPPITGVRQPLAEIGRILAKVLLETIDAPHIRQSVYLPASLHMRDSTVPKTKSPTRPA